jgi:hypothetical protein
MEGDTPGLAVRVDRHGDKPTEVRDTNFSGTEWSPIRSYITFSTPDKLQGFEKQQFAEGSEAVHNEISAF